MCLPSTFICASCSDVLILWLLFPAGPPCYTHWKEHRAQPSWALPRQINNVNLRSFGEVIFPAISSALTVLNIHPDCFLIGVGEPENTSYNSPWFLEYPGTWWRRKWTKVCCPSRDGEKKALGPHGLSLGGVYLGTRKKGGAFPLPCGTCRSTFNCAVSQSKLRTFQQDTWDQHAHDEF